MHTSAAVVGRWQGSQDASKLPLWQLLGGNVDPRSGGITAGCWGFPAGKDGGRIGVAQLPGLGERADANRRSWRHNPSASLAGPLLHESCSSFMKGLSEASEGVFHSQLTSVVPDGRPIFGFHPGRSLPLPGVACNQT